MHQGLFSVEATFSEDCLSVFVQRTCAAPAQTSMCTSKIPSIGSRTIVWTQQNTTHTPSQPSKTESGCQNGRGIENDHTGNLPPEKTTTTTTTTNGSHYRQKKRNTEDVLMTDFLGRSFGVSTNSRSWAFLRGGYFQ